MDCPLNYIPEHLHQKSREIIPDFKIGEKLYYRSKPENLKRPYDNISLRDISHNRNFNNDELYPKKDVLFNVNEEDERERYEDLEIVILEITNLGENTTYLKEIKSKTDTTITVVITLKHSPLVCMYPHSVFEISVNGEIVDEDNYNQTLGRKNKTFSNLRSEIRQELTLIIQNNNIDSSLETEYIEKP